MNRLLAGAALGAMVFSLAPAISAATPALSAVDTRQIATSYDKLTQDYYEKTSPQAIVDGARTSMLNAMKKAGVKNAKLPVVHASASAAHDVALVRDQVEAAAKISGKKLSPKLLSYAAISGMLGSVHDKYTVFLTPKEFAALNQDLDGTNFGGTGIVIMQDETTKEITVSSVIPNGPADKAGVQQDDEISTIDGASTKGDTLAKASDRLRGKIGTKVVLGIVRNGAPIAPITIVRQQIHQVSVFDRMLPGNIGYVALSVFGRTTGAELTTALKRLRKEGARAIVMDLRNNGGGYLDAAVDVSSKFIPAGPIVSIESRGSGITTYDAEDTAIAPMPLAVLVNKYTASASEITSGAIQDDGAGVIIGAKTYGKGVVQNIYRLEDGSAIKITTARYLTPLNHDINHRGITPDIAIAENKSPRFGEPAHDAQLRRAISYLDDRLAHDAAIGETTATPTPVPTAASSQ